MASFKKLNTGWQYRVSVKINGKHTTKSGNGYATKREAQIAASKIEEHYSKGYDLKTNETLFPIYFRNWYEVYRKGKLSKDNDGDIERAVKFAENHFEGVRLKDLTRELYQKALNEFGQNHATATVKKHHTYMRTCIQDAIQEGIIFKDPTYRIKAIGQIAPKDEHLKFLNYNESIRLIHVLTKDIKPEYTSRYMILFGLATGCRFSEVAGMTWSCVNFENKTVKIKQTWDYKYTNDFSNTKNYQSNRTITLDDDTLRYLKQLKIWQSELKLKGMKNEKDLVFLNRELTLNSNSAVNKTLRKFCKRIGATEITSHGLRHTHASILLYQGVNIKYVSRRLGHSDIGTTLGTYHHILDELDQKENTVVNELLYKMYN